MLRRVGGPVVSDVSIHLVAFVFSNHHSMMDGLQGFFTLSHIPQKSKPLMLHALKNKF